MILERYKHIRIPKPLMAVTVGEGQGLASWWRIQTLVSKSPPGK